MKTIQILVPAVAAQLADMIGLIPDFLQEDDMRPAREQFNERYAHGGGWRPMKGFEVDAEMGTIQYPDDPPLKPIAAFRFHDELIYIYPHAWVRIEQADGSSEIARMD